MRYLSLWLPCLPTDRIARRNKVEPGDGLVTIAKLNHAQRLVAVDRAAASAGLKPGMMLADARAMRPMLIAHPADLEGEAQTLFDITDWCRRFTPLAAVDAPDGAMLDMTGAAHLFGGEAKLLEEMIARLAAQGFAAQAALAPTPEAAWALARFGHLRRLPPILPEGSDEKAIAQKLGPLPLAALRLSEVQLAGLAQAGLRRIDDLLLRPRAPLVARFGASLFARLDGLLGRAKSPISPRFEAAPYLVERRFAEALIRREDVEATILALAGELTQLLARHGEGARRLDLALFRVDGAVRHIEVGLSRPSREPPMMARLFREKIEALAAESEDDPLDCGFGFDVLRLSALSVERRDDEQTQWLKDAHDPQDLAALVDRLGARLGVRRVMRLAFADTHIPEFAVTTVAVSSAKTRGDPSPLAGEGGLTKSGRMRGGHCEEHQRRSNPDGLAGLLRSARNDGMLPLRPLRLLFPPEPIEAIAGVPDGPPLRFRWRRVLHEIAAIEGPERIASEWWKHDDAALDHDGFGSDRSKTMNVIDSEALERDFREKPVSTFSHPALTRDYFRAEDQEGQRFWLFREGLYGRETAAPRWFMHGLFA